jgi:hypothetical protein
MRLEPMKKLAPGAYESKDGRFSAERGPYAGGHRWRVVDEWSQPKGEAVVDLYDHVRAWIADRRQSVGLIPEGAART